MTILVLDTFTGGVGPLSGHIGEIGASWAPISISSFNNVDYADRVTINGSGSLVDLTTEWPNGGVTPSGAAAMTDADHFIEIDFSYSGACYPYLGFLQTADSSNGYTIYMEFGSAGENVVLDLYTNSGSLGEHVGALAANTTHTLCIEFTPTTKTVLLNGTPVITATNSSFSSGFPWLYLGNPDSANTISVSRFKVGSGTAAAAAAEEAAAAAAAAALAAAAAAAAAALSSNSVTVVQMVHLAFSTPIALNMSTWNLDWDGVTYRGAYGLGTVSTINDKPGELQGLQFQMFGDIAAIALALDDSDVVQGTVCTIRTAIISTATYQVLDAPIEWLGELDTMSISEDGQSCTIQVSAESKAIDLLRGTPMFYSDADQRTVNPTDTSFAYVIDQIDKPIVWPARNYFMR